MYIESVLLLAGTEDASAHKLGQVKAGRCPTCLDEEAARATGIPFVMLDLRPVVMVLLFKISNGERHGISHYHQRPSHHPEIYP